MPRLIEKPTVIEAAGNLPKRIEEYVGRVNSGEKRLSLARMVAPPGWVEPGQTPAFDEFTVVLRGTLVIETKTGRLEVRGGQAVECKAGEWIRYSCPGPGETEYLAVCLPAFSPDTVHRDPT